MRIIKLGILTLALSSLMMGCTLSAKEADAQEIQGTPIKTQLIEHITRENDYHVFGYTQSEGIIEVGGQSGATIDALYVSVGDEVHTGDVLMTLTYSASETQLSNQISSAQNAANIAQQIYVQRLESNASAHVLYDAGAVSEYDVNASDLNLSQAQNDLKSANNNLETLLAQQEEFNAYLRVVSPTDGVIADITSLVGEKSSGSDISIAKSSLKTIEFSVPLRVANVVEKGDHVTIETEMGTFDGTIQHINFETNGLGAQMRVASSDNGTLRSGVFAEVSIPYELLENVYAVPNDTIIHSGEFDMVFVANDDTAEARTIEILKYEGSNTIVRGTLQDGERLVVEGQHKLFEGEKIISY